MSTEEFERRLPAILSADMAGYGVLADISLLSFFSLVHLPTLGLNINLKKYQI